MHTRMDGETDKSVKHIQHKITFTGLDIIRLRGFIINSFSCSSTKMSVVGVQTMLLNDTFFDNPKLTFRLMDNGTLVKSAYQKCYFLISQPKYMLWVLKRTVSMRRFF